MPVQCTCTVCGSTFFRFPSQVGPTCSPRCRGTVQGRLNGRAQQVSHPPVLCTCVLCGAAFTVKPSRFARGDVQFCSRRCSDDAKMQSVEAIWDFVDKIDDQTSCWLWTGTLLSNGYGQIRISNRKIGAHTAAWRAAGGTIPAKRVIGHTCDNPPCCRNDDFGTYAVASTLYERRGHLWLATPAANSADMAAKGRSRNKYTPV